MRSAHIALPRRYVVELELCDASNRIALARFSRFNTAGAIALAVSLVTVVTVGDAAPPQIVPPRPTLFHGVLTPTDARAWMRASIGIHQPSWIGNPDAR